MMTDLIISIEKKESNTLTEECAGRTMAIKLNRMRQQDLIADKLFKGSTVSLIGAGGIGSPTAICLAKMGVERIVAWDEDGVDDINIPNQLYRVKDVGQFKVDALQRIIGEFSDTEVVNVRGMFRGGRTHLNELAPVVIVATDSMASRRLVWEEFLKQRVPHHLIEARMGAKLGMVYVISKKLVKGHWIISPKDFRFYEAHLYSDDKVKPVPCTAKAIIYNTFMISSLICRAYESILKKEKHFPREMIFNMTYMDERSWMRSE
jgi:hypothetical protein